MEKSGSAPADNGAPALESKNLSDEEIRQHPSASSQEQPIREKRTFARAVIDNLKEPGSALQIVIAAALAIAIGLIVTSTTDSIPAPVAPLIGIPGTLWLRSLKAVGKLLIPGTR